MKKPICIPLGPTVDNSRAGDTEATLTSSADAEEMSEDSRNLPERATVTESSDSVTASLITSLANQGEQFHEITGALARLESQLHALCITVEGRLSYDKAKEDAFEKLYVELEELKRNSVFEQLRPLFIDFILLFDRLENVRNEVSGSNGVPKTVGDIVRTVSEELVEILYRREIELVKTTSDLFDPSLQQAIGTEPTTVESENNRVARVIRRGFRYRNRLLRPEEVIVKKQETLDAKKGI
jgi:molecular chaperone GrpE